MQMPAMLKGWRKTVSEEGDINWKNGSVTLFKQMMPSIVLDNDSIILILWCYLILRFNFLCFFEYFNTTELLFRTVIRLQLYPLNDDHVLWIRMYPLKCKFFSIGHVAVP